MARIQRPFYPIIYVRGYAMTRDEVIQTTSTPYMGFEAGSTKIRQAQDGRVVKFVFESPLVRLMKDYDYRDVYASGAENVDRLPARSIVIHRYYDVADRMDDLVSGCAQNVPKKQAGQAKNVA